MKTIKRLFIYSSLFIALGLLGITNAQAQVQDSTQTDLQLDTSSDNEEIEEIEENLMGNIDSLLSIWYLQRALSDSITLEPLSAADTMMLANMPDSIFEQRLKKLCSPVHLPFNNIVKGQIYAYIQKRPERTEMILGLAEYYLPLFEEILDQYGLPLELKAMPVIESALNPRAISSAGAAGMWQFMLRTGRNYKLTINSNVDERLDPVKSAHAAAKYMTYLYSIFNDWTLCVAAYNCGEGRVLKAIKRAGGKADFWEIYPYLPRETRVYVPIFVAATYFLNYYKEHGLTPKTINRPMATDTFIINKMLHFDQIANVIDIPIDELRDLNPQYRRDVIPGLEKPYILNIPFEYTAAFIDKEQEIYAYKDSIYSNLNKRTSPANYSASTGSTDGRGQIIHRVKKGETIGGIALTYRVSVSDLKYWNNIGKRNLIRENQKLIVYSSKKASASTTASSTKSQTATAIAPGNDGYIYHTVKKGENFWSISQKYDDVNVNDILKLNGFTEKTKIYPKQKIKIKKA